MVRKTRTEPASNSPVDVITGAQSEMNRSDPIFQPEEGELVVRKGEPVRIIKVDKQLEPPSYVVRLESGREVGCELQNLSPASRQAKPNDQTNVAQNSIGLEPEGLRRLSAVLNGFGPDGDESAQA